MEAEGWASCTQEPAAGSYPGPYVSNVHYTLFLNDPF
jgi:hypothetical protein